MNELEEWNVERVGVWLEENGLSSVRQRFIGKHLLSHG